MAKALPGLRGARKRAALSQRALQDRSGISYVNVSRIENGQPATPETVEKLAWALGTDAEELYGGEGQANSDLAYLVRSMGHEVEPYFTELSIRDGKALVTYESAYIRLLAAEKHARKGGPDLFDSRLDDHVAKLVRAVKAMRPGEEREQVRERARRIARRAAAVFEQEAVRLESEAEAKRAEERRLREVDLELTGAA